MNMHMEEKQIKKLGFALILIGTTLLLFTFYQAYSYLKSPYLPPPQIPDTAASGQPDINRAIAQAFAPFFSSILPVIYSSGYLFIMGLIGSWILGRGIQLVK